MSIHFSDAVIRTSVGEIVISLVDDRVPALTVACPWSVAKVLRDQLIEAIAKYERITGTEILNEEQYAILEIRETTKESNISAKTE